MGLRKYHFEKANGGDGIPVELFQILKDDAVKVLHSLCQQIWKTQQWPQDWKSSVFIPTQIKTMGSRWGNSGNSVRLYFLGSKITADGDRSHEIKRRLFLGRKVMTYRDSILTRRDITLLTKGRLVNAMVFPVMYGCESWTVKKAESERIDAFEL